MQQDIKDLISTESILKAFLLRFENKKIIIEHFSVFIYDFIKTDDQHNVYYYGDFGYFQDISFENQRAKFLRGSLKSVISGSNKSSYSNDAVLTQVLKITII